MQSEESYDGSIFGEESEPLEYEELLKQYEEEKAKREGIEERT